MSESKKECKWSAPATSRNMRAFKLRFARYLGKWLWNYTVVRVAGASGALHVEKLLSVGAPVAGRLPVAGRSAGRPSVRPDKHTRTSANGRKVAQEVEKGAQITSKKHI